MTAPSIPALLEPIQERLDAAEGRVHNPMFGDVLRIVWTTYYFGADLKWHNARSGEVEDAQTLVAELEASEGDWEWLIPGSGADTARLLAAVKAVVAVHEPMDALMNPGARHERVVKVCTGCGTDDGNWQRFPCPTVSAVEAALREEA